MCPSLLTQSVCHGEGSCGSLPPHGTLLQQQSGHCAGRGVGLQECYVALNGNLLSTQCGLRVQKKCIVANIVDNTLEY